MAAAEQGMVLKVPRLRGRRIKVFLLACVIFACGIIVGMALMFRLGGPPMRIPPMPENAPERIANDLRRDLNLDDKQAKAVLEIVQQDRVVLESIRIRVDDEVLAQMESSQKKISQLLRSDQREKFNKRFEQLKNRFRPGQKH